MENTDFVFQVNLKGIIELLSEHIYSNPNVFIRELLQNAVDAITERQSIDETHKGAITATVKEGEELLFEDNGIGLTEEQVHRFLAVIGESSKRGSVIEKDLIGRFGIGLLSCLVVSNEIIVKTRSLLGNENITWTGRADGTYSIEKTEENFSTGTRVLLKPKKEWKHLFEKAELKKTILYYGNALPYPIFLSTGQETENLTEKIPAWLDENAPKEDILKCGKELFKANFPDAFRLYSDSGGITGIAYILPNKTQFLSTHNHKVYLKRMFLGNDAGNLFPKWASFTNCVINTNKLKPTASRETLVDDEALKQEQTAIADCFKTYFTGLAVNDTHLLQEIIRTHHMYIKAMASEDPKMLEIFLDYLPFETNSGRQSFLSIRTYNNVIYYTPNLDDFRQIRRIAHSQGLVVINAAYSFEEDIIKKIIVFHPHLTIKRITPNEVMSAFSQNVEPNTELKQFQQAADKIVNAYYCKAELKHFSPADTPAMYIGSEQAINNKNAQSISQKNNPFASALSDMHVEKENTMPALCLNMDNELVQQLSRLTGNEVFEPIVNILYVQSLLLGQYPVNKKEMDIFNNSIYQLSILSMSDLTSFINN